jgi:hypothetical protein
MKNANGKTIAIAAALILEDIAMPSANPNPMESRKRGCLRMREKGVR